jgi:hypothetical protein
MIWANTNAELPAPWRKHQSNGVDTIRNGMQVWVRDEVEETGEMLNDVARAHGYTISEDVTREMDARLEAHRKARAEAERKSSARR